MRALARGALLTLLLVGCGARAQLSEAEAALGRGDLVTAELAFRKALEHDPKGLEALYGLGWTLHLAGERDLARSTFQRAAELHPQSPLGWKGLGSVAMAEGNAPLAKKRFEDALARAPGEATVRLSLALLSLGGGDAGGALRELDALASEDPTRAEVQLARAEALLRLKRPEEARSAADTAVTHAPSVRLQAQARVMLARVMLASAAGRVRAEDCPGTLPPVLAWLDAADAALDEADALQARVPDLVEVRRVVRAQRGRARDACPGGVANGG